MNTSKHIVYTTLFIILITTVYNMMQHYASIDIVLALLISVLVFFTVAAILIISLD